MKNKLPFISMASTINYPAIVIALLVLSFFISQTTFAQGVIGNAIKNKVRDKVIQKSEEAIDEGFENKESDDQNESEKAEPEELQEEKATTANQPVKQKIEAKSQYDFVPGDKVLFFEDFSQDAIGDFPALWTTTGSGEVKTVNVATGNWLHMTSPDQVYNLMKDLNLPENFIFEFDLIAQPQAEDGNFDFYLTFYNSADDFLDDQLYPGVTGMHITISDWHWAVRGYHNEKDKMLDGESTLSPVINNDLNHIIVWVQKSRVRIYHKGQKVVDMPTILYTPTNFNRLRFSLWSCQGSPLVSNIRITTAAPDTRSKLLTEGKLISYGIYFNVNSDKIKPESKGAIGDIAKVLSENPTVRVRIDGHTDSDGDDAKNMDLSQRRAASVKNMLVAEYGINADRIETGGYGETKPVAPNTTSEGKAQNRRVEFIRL